LITNTTNSEAKLPKTKHTTTPYYYLCKEGHHFIGRCVSVTRIMEKLLNRFA